MPARIVDGDALWGSDKIKNLDPRVQPEYANLVPLAEVNGVFEVNSARIHQRVYAYNRPSVTLEMVEFILEDLIRVDLLRTWEMNGKTYGYWTGIDKPGAGRLPPPSQRKKFKNFMPSPPCEIVSAPDKPSSPLDGEVVESPMGLLSSYEEDDMSYKQNLKESIQKYFGVGIRDDDFAWNEIRTLNGAYGADRVLDAFETWAGMNSDKGYRNPLSAFAKVAASLLFKPMAMTQEHPELDELSSDLYLAGDQSFNGKSRTALNDLLQKYPADEIKEAYLEFIENKDQSSIRFAPRDFAEGGARDVILARRKRKVILQQQAELYERAKQEAIAAPRLVVKVEEEEEFEMPEV